MDHTIAILLLNVSRNEEYLIKRTSERCVLSYAKMTCHVLSRCRQAKRGTTERAVKLLGQPQTNLMITISFEISGKVPRGRRKFFLSKMKLSFSLKHDLM